MKILIPMLSLGPHGGNRVLIEIANHLVSKGVDVVILTTSLHKKSKYPLDERISIIYRGRGRSKLDYFRMLFSILFFNKYDLVLVNHFSTYIPSFFSSLLFRKKLVNIVQDLEYNFHNGLIRVIARFICYLSYRAKYVISANDYLYEKLVGLGFNVTLRVNVGVAEAFFEKNQNYNPYSLSAKEFDVIHFARSQTHKRLDLLLLLVDEIKKTYPSFKIAFASGDEVAIRKVNGHGYHCYRPKSDAELINLIDRCRFYLLVSKHEGFALPPLECMARGVPLLYYPCGGPSVYANLENSYVLDDSNIERSASEIVNMLTGNISLVDGAIESANKFKMSTAINSIVDFIMQVLRS